MTQVTNYQQILQQEITELKEKINQAKMPAELKFKTQRDIVALERSVELGNYDTKHEKVSKYIDWVLKIPWEDETKDRLDIEQAKEIFNKHHYGMQEVKDRFLEYISVLSLREQNYQDEDFRAPILLLVGLVGEANQEIMGVLVELLDPAQNHSFVDNYIDYPVDLSKAIFLATANNTGRILTAVMDRLEKITMPSYTDHEKMVIGKQYIFPELLKKAGLKQDQLIINEDVWPDMIRPLGFDAGIRTLQRTLEGAVRKAARIIVERGFDQVIITQENAKIFLPKY